MNDLTVISDPGIDDLIALALLNKLDTTRTICLVSSFGNGPEHITAQNAQEFISFVAPSWQFTHGSFLPKNGTVEHPWPTYFHGPDGVWGVHPVTDTSSIRPLTTYPQHDSVISLATLTDVSKLYQTHASTNITLMGGAFSVDGNETQYAETNIAFDPDAADKFFRQFSSDTLVRIVPLDVTQKVSWSFDQVLSIPESNSIHAWLKKLLITWFECYDHSKEKDFQLHDPLAVYLSVFPEKAIWYSRGVEVVLTGKQRGQTMFTDRNNACEIAVDLTSPNTISEDIFSFMFY